MTKACVSETCYLATTLLLAVTSAVTSRSPVSLRVAASSHNVRRGDKKAVEQVLLAVKSAAEAASFTE